MYGRIKKDQKEKKQKNNQKRVKAKVCCSEEFKDEQKKRAMFWTLYNGNVDCFPYNITYTRRNKKRTRDKKVREPSSSWIFYLYLGRQNKKGSMRFSLSRFKASAYRVPLCVVNKWLNVTYKSLASKIRCEKQWGRLENTDSFRLGDASEIPIETNRYDTTKRVNQ